MARFAQFHPPKLSLLVAIPLILINFRGVKIFIKKLRYVCETSLTLPLHLLSDSILTLRSLISINLHAALFNQETREYN